MCFKVQTDLIFTNRYLDEFYSSRCDNQHFNILIGDLDTCGLSCLLNNPFNFGSSKNIEEVLPGLVSNNRVVVPLLLVRPQNVVHVEIVLIQVEIFRSLDQVQRVDRLENAFVELFEPTVTDNKGWDASNTQILIVTSFIL